ncbi:hypothetical protein SRHO_G00209880 [Serrasalmus rhombeus]
MCRNSAAAGVPTSQRSDNKHTTSGHRAQHRHGGVNRDSRTALESLSASGTGKEPTPTQAANKATKGTAQQRSMNRAATVQSSSASESQQSGYSAEHNRAPTTKSRFTIRTFKTLKQPLLVRGSTAGVESRLPTHLYCVKLISRDAPAVRPLPTLSSGCSALSRPER